jgi:extradiol dioxygenase
VEIYGIAYVGYESPNHRSMEQYGPEVYGFGLNESRDDGSVYLTMDDHDYRIAVHPGPVARQVYVGLSLKDKWEFENAVETLRSAGIAVKVGDEDLEAQRGCYGVAQFNDPAGWPMELCYGRKIATGSFVPGRPISGFQTKRYGLGHTVLAASDLAEINNYCKNVMGYRWYIHGLRKNGASFWRFKNNDLSHNIAYAIIPGFAYEKNMMVPHIGIYCNTLDDVGIACDIVQEQHPDRMEMTLGRHMQDPVISFYAKTPAGFTIECIWGEELDIRDDTYVESQSSRLSIWGHKQVGSGVH